MLRQRPHLIQNTLRTGWVVVDLDGVDDGVRPVLVNDLVGNHQPGGRAAVHAVPLQGNPAPDGQLKLPVRVHDEKGHGISLAQPVSIHVRGQQELSPLKGIKVHRDLRRLVIGFDDLSVHSHQQAPEGRFGTVYPDLGVRGLPAAFPLKIALDLIPVSVYLRGILLIDGDDLRNAKGLHSLHLPQPGHDLRREGLLLLGGEGRPAHVVIEGNVVGRIEVHIFVHRQALQHRHTQQKCHAAQKEGPNHKERLDRMPESIFQTHPGQGGVVGGAAGLTFDALLGVPQCGHGRDESDLSGGHGEADKNHPAGEQRRRHGDRPMEIRLGKALQ